MIVKTEPAGDQIADTLKGIFVTDWDKLHQFKFKCVNELRLYLLLKCP